MSLLDDDTLQMYVQESLDHLGAIEQDLLTIEAAGAAIDAERVNKVFRAAHSIKGGAGFLGLHTVNELAHKLENVLGLVRGGEMVPTPELVNVLLRGFDKLRELMEAVDTSNDADIAEHTVALEGLTTALLPEERKATVARQHVVALPGGRAAFEVSAFELAEARKGGKQLYLLEIDLVRDVERRGATPLEVIRELDDGGTIVDCRVDLAAAGTLADPPAEVVLPFFVLYATIVAPEIFPTVFELPAERVHPLSDAQVREVPPPAAQPPKPAPPAPAPQAAPKPPPAAAMPRTAAPGHQPEASLRVQVRLLDNLMTLAGELVLGRNQLVQALGTGDQRSLEVVTQHLDLITSELQEAIMLTRMQPVGNILNKFPRVVRDLSQKLAKEVELTLEGAEVELDKTIIEGLSDPLTHLVRNAVDHGIEAPSVRVAAGKPAQGTVALRAYHAAGQVLIEITDDGKGLDGDKLAEAAVTKGLLTAEHVRTLSAKERVHLIFLPGFSTATQVTDVSGRGVGMDVVRTNLDTLGGVVEIDSEVGRGSTIRIKLPLTLAIIPSQVVTCCGQRFAIPQVNMDELLRIPAAQVQKRLEVVGSAEVVRLRGQLLPLVRLSEVLGMDATFVDPETGERRPDRRSRLADRRSRTSPLQYTDGAAEAVAEAAAANEARRTDLDRRYRACSAMNVVVASTGVFRYGLVVDELLDAEEIVVKPLGRHLKQCAGYAGATIMGNGQVALILDVTGLAQRARLASVAGTDRAAQVAREASAGGDERLSDTLLMFRNAPDEQFAAPLERVQRIEQIRPEQVETVAGRRVMQHKGGTLPLYCVEDVTPVRSRAPDARLMVLVLAGARGEVGLLVAGHLDSYHGEAAVDRTALRLPGIAGTLVIAGVTTLVLDLDEFLRRAGSGPPVETARAAPVQAN